jgi:hypothetical protein
MRDIGLQSIHEHADAEYHPLLPTSMKALATAVLFALSQAGCSVDPAPNRIECDPGLAPCAAETPLGRVVLELSPRPIAPMSPLQVAVDAAGPLDDVRIELMGRDMDMGPNVARLTPLAATRWRGAATIPVCTTGRMHWDAILVLRLGPRTERLVFGFQAG